MQVEFVEMSVANAEMVSPKQILPLSTDMTFTVEEMYFVEKINSQIQHHLEVDDCFFEAMIGLMLGTLDVQGFSKVFIS